MKFLIGFVAIALLLSFRVAASTCTWNGMGRNGYWNVGTNWQGNVAPKSGDDLIFPGTATTLTTTNNFPADTTFNSILLTGTNYLITGNEIYLSSGITNYGATNKFLVPVTLLQNQRILNSGQGTFTIGAVNLGSNRLFVTDFGYPPPGMIISGEISGAGGIQIDVGNVWLSASNSYRGGTIITNTYNGSSIVLASTASALGSASSPITIGTAGPNVSSSWTGMLELTNDVVIPQPIIIFATQTNGSTSGHDQIVSLGGTNVISGTILLTNTNPGGVPSYNPNVAAKIGVEKGNLIISNTISGNCGLNKVGVGQLTFCAANNFKDPTWANDDTCIEMGTLLCNAPPGASCIPGSLSLTSWGGSIAPVVKFTAPVTLNEGRGIFIYGGTVDFNGQTVISPLLGGGSFGQILGTINLNGGSLIAGSSVSNSVFPGLITNNGTFQKVGTKSLTLSGNNSFTGNTTVSAGALVINGLQTNSPINLLSGTLVGTGYCATVIAQAGQVGTLSSWGTLHIMGDLVLQSSTSFATAITNTNGFGALDVSGNIQIDAATLLFTNSVAAAPGTVLTLIKNNGDNPIAGGFNNIGDGAIFASSAGNPFQFSYMTAASNNFILTRVQPPAAFASIFPSGSSIQITGSGVPNANYWIQASTNLVNWQYLYYATCSPGGVISYTNPPGSLPRRFYRILSQ